MDSLWINEKVKNKLSYNSETGVFTWKENGKQAGGLNSNGYRRIFFNKKKYLAHRLAYYFYYGKNPKFLVDHINGKKDDNRIVNLREVTSRENGSNFFSHRNGKLVGTTYSKTRKKWIAQGRINGKQCRIGQFKTEKEAHLAYLDAINKEK